jgi:hypothetical protein
MSLTNAAGKLLEGKIERTVNKYRSPQTVPKGRGYKVTERTGGRLDIIIESMPAITLKTGIPEGDGSFALKSLDFLAGNPSGWVEFSLELSGTGNFVAGDGYAGLRLNPPVEPVRISGAKIRRTGTHLSGEDAILVTNNRYERIQALTEWMRERDVPREVTRNLRDFEAYWKPLLLSETEITLPEELQPLRDSGTLKRDWEEGYEWIFLVYAWENIFNPLEISTVELLKG